MGTQIERSFFTTDNITDNKQRILAWRDSASFMFDVNPVAPADKAAFHASIESYYYGSLVTSICRSHQARWSRTPLDAARNGVDHFLVQIFIHGNCRFTGDARDTTFEPGDICILDATRTTRTITSDFTNFTLWVPRSLLEAHLHDPDSLHGRVIKAHMPIAKVLRSYLWLMHEQAAQMSHTEGKLLTQPTLELLLAAIDASPNPGESLKNTNTAMILIAVKRHIHQHLNSECLTSESIARAVNVSRATLYRVCVPLGGIANYIRQQRLRQILRNLTDRRHAHLSIARIADRWGFHDASSFTRAFRKEFGLSPSEARHDLRSPQTGNTVSAELGGLVGDRQYEHWLTRMLG